MIRRSIRQVFDDSMIQQGIRRLNDSTGNRRFNDILYAMTANHDYDTFKMLQNVLFFKFCCISRDVLKVNCSLMLKYCVIVAYTTLQYSTLLKRTIWSSLKLIV